MNFEFIKEIKEFKALYQFCRDAEQLAIQRPYLSGIAARNALEYIVKFIYGSRLNTDASRMTIFDMTDSQNFQDYIADPVLLHSIHFVRKIGNISAHDGSLSKEDALKNLEQLHFVTGELFINLGLINDYPQFTDNNLVVSAVKPDEKKIVQQKVEVPEEIFKVYADKLRHTRFNVKYNRDESENKKLFLYACLREAGWGVVNKPNTTLPNSASLNMTLDSGEKLDYVLNGRDNRPLAIIEFSDNPIEARMAAIKKADQLGVKFGYKPVIYYTNGYNIFCIDQLGYPPRRVFQFHTLEELELLKQRASSRQDITSPAINDQITNRDYQKKAIAAACKAFTENRRHALLVMATGTGKTRVSISLVDVLMKAGWIKNVLFLADRTSLVRQAHKNFTKLLPSVTTSVYAGGSMNRDSNARIIFSTYQTMIKLINDDTREFGIGRFDLIIIDEAHRSIFNKYGSLFHYFDSLIIGLTATPRCEENKSTYEMFHLENANPDFAYELEEAISDGYLVGFSVEDKTTELMRRGTKYDDLSDEEKASFEDAFTDDENKTPDFSGAELGGDVFKNRNVINIGTIDVMLNDLMKNGLKINGGDKIGKTIIFATSHYEAEKIVERFNHLYKNFGRDFCKLIDSQVDEHLTLIDLFGERDSLPQIAVSVDMMDTGIDVPDVLNLVFFKSVKSKIKFIQMIGRGTRLSPDLFGPGYDKKGFLILDYYDNFNYFNTNNTWSMIDNGLGEKGSVITPQSQLINQKKLSILIQLQRKKNLVAFETTYKQELYDNFISELRSLTNDNIEVAYNMPYVSKYRTAENWNNLSDTQLEEIADHIIPLIHPSSDPAKTKTFDLLILAIEDEYSKREQEGKDVRKIRHGFKNVSNIIDDYMCELLKLKHIPDVVKQEELVTKMRHADYLLDNFSFELAEDIRKKLRELVAYIPNKKNYVVVNIKDWFEDDGDSPVTEKSYTEKANEYILNSNSVELAKIRNLDVLSEDEKNNLKNVFMNQLGTEVDYNNWSGNTPLLPFLRLQTGIADEAIQTKFGSFLNSSTLDDTQLDFMNEIVSFARENGDITFMDLQRVSPFCDYDIADLFGESISYIKVLIDGLHKPVM